MLDIIKAYAETKDYKGISEVMAQPQTRLTHIQRHKHHNAFEFEFSVFLVVVVIVIHKK